METNTKPGFKTSEFLMALVGIAVAVIPVILEKVPKESAVAIVLGLLLVVLTYITQRGWVKVTDSKAAAIAAQLAGPVTDAVLAMKAGQMPAGGAGAAAPANPPKA